MSEAKTLVNCTPTEFVAQTVKIRRAAERWLDVTKLMEIRSQSPQYKVAPEGVTQSERAEIIRENSKLQKEQVRKNMVEIFDACFEKHPRETLEVMALCCFVEPSDVDSHPMSYYLSLMNSIMNDVSVIDFFTSLARLGRTSGSLV